jgi:hypothetical protein
MKSHDIVRIITKLSMTISELEDVVEYLRNKIQ